MTKFVNKTELVEAYLAMLWYVLLALVCSSIIVCSIIVGFIETTETDPTTWLLFALFGGIVCACQCILRTAIHFETSLERWRKLRRRYRKQFRKISELEPKDFIP